MYSKKNISFKLENLDLRDKYVNLVRYYPVN